MSLVDAAKEQITTALQSAKDKVLRQPLSNSAPTTPYRNCLLQQTVLQASNSWTPAPVNIKKLELGTRDLESGVRNSSVPELCHCVTKPHYINVRWSMLFLVSQLPPSPSKKKVAPGSAWSYVASWKWVKPVAIWAALYCLSLLLLLKLFRRLPSTETLATKVSEGDAPSKPKDSMPHKCLLWQLDARRITVKPQKNSMFSVCLLVSIQ